MTIGAQRSSRGEGPIQDRSAAAGRPGHDRKEDLLISEGSVRWVEDSLCATVAYQGDESPAVRAEDRSSIGGEDGFPEVDDLVDQPLGQYRLEQVIGRGSMGRVYRAEHLGLFRSCA